MTTESDLKSLKELLKLKKCINIADQKTREKYNSIVEWASNKFWKINTYMVIDAETSISDYYNTSKKESFILKDGKYVFLPMCFGNVFIYFKGTMMELGSGNIQYIDIKIKKKIDKLLKENLDIEFLRFVYFKGEWILEDCFSKCKCPINFLKTASTNGLNTVPYILLNTKEIIFTEDDYENIDSYFTFYIKEPFKISSLCYIEEGNNERNIIDFYKKTYVFVESIKIENIHNNYYIPKIVTKSKNVVLVRDINHLIESKIKINSFISVKKKKYFLILDNNSIFSLEKPSEAFCRIMKYIGNEFYVNGKYLSKVSNDIEIKHLSSKLGLLSSTLSELITEISLCDKLREKIKNQSVFEFVMECLEYPKADFITLVNNMSFDVKNGIVLNFKLENINCLDNPNISAIYGNFNKFISLFNIFIDVKQSLFKAY
ncbi:DNA polymerase processivity factor [Goatpox virus]|uniref:DNA polymerase processivity factor n=1 Tax=Goatpox virus TaxID=186805 RepID=A0A5C0PSN0_9POXV|nr:DNA polymerase processivity factor [Goatpox virus]